MSFKTQREIYEHLLKGGKIQFKHTRGVVYLDENGMLNDISYSLRSPDKWQPYEEPKKKVKLYKWAFKDEKGKWSETPNFYKEDKDVDKIYGPYKYTMRLDYTMIEVDEE